MKRARKHAGAAATAIMDVVERQWSSSATAKYTQIKSGWWFQPDLKNISQLG